MISKDTILSAYDDKLTLLQWLKKTEQALEDGVLESAEIVDQTATNCKIKFNFADGTSITTDAIDLKGAKGDTGNPATVAVGTVSTLPAGSSATVTNSGTTSNAVFNFGIPKGDTGEDGGVTTFGGQTGAITIGDGLTMSGKQVKSYDFNFTDIASVDFSLISSTIFSNFSGTLTVALNASKSIGKVYGRFAVDVANVSAGGNQYIKIGSVAVPSTAYNIATGNIALASDFTKQRDVGLRVDAYGNLYVGIYLDTTDNGKRFLVYNTACIYFFKDFGDNLAKGIKPLDQRMNDLEGEER